MQAFLYPKCGLAIDRNRGTDLAPAGEAPLIWEAAALLRFCGVYRARGEAIFVLFEETAGAIGAFDEGEAGAGGIETGVLGDKAAFGHAEMCGECCDVGFSEAHISRPTTTIAAAFTSVADG